MMAGYLFSYWFDTNSLTKSSPLYYCPNDGSSPQAHGKSLNDFVEKHQDSSKNALRKSLEAAFAAWCEEVRADQAQYCADKVMTLVLFWVVFIGLWDP